MQTESIFSLVFLNIWNWVAVIFILIYGLTVYHRSKDPIVLNTIPGFCTGIGVLLTFTILFINLQDGSFDFSNTGSSSTSLAKLVQKLAGAFSTSIIGVFSSLIANYFVKRKISRLEIAALNGNSLKHPQLMLQEVVDASHSNEQSITSLNNSIMAMQRTFEERIEKLFRTMTNSLQHSVSNISRDALTAARSSIQDTNDKLVKSSLTLIKEHNESLTAATTANQTKMEEIFEEMSNLGTLIRQQMEEAEQRADNSIEEIETSFQTSVDSMTKNFAYQTGQLQATFGEVNQGLSFLASKIENRMTQAEVKANESIGKIEQGFATSVNTMTSKFETQATQLQTTFENVQNTMKVINEDIQQQINTILEDNLANLTNTFDHIEEMSAAAQGNLLETSKKFADAVNQYEASKGENEQVATQIAAQIESNKALREDMIKLLEKWQTLSNDVEKMQHRVGDIANTITNLNTIKKNIVQFSSNGH